MVGYPALVDEGDTVALRVLPTEAEQAAAMWAGVRRLLLLGAPSPVKYVSARLDGRAKLALTQNPHGSLAALLADCSAAAVDEILAEAGGPPWDAEGFAKLADRVRAELAERVLELLRAAQQVLAVWGPLTARLDEPVPPPLRPAYEDVRAQVAGLVGPGFVAGTGRRRLADVRRWLAAAEHRLDRLPGDTARDATRTARVHAVEAELASFVAGLPPARRDTDAVRQLRWMVQELRVNVFAQVLGTPYPVSEQRIYRAMDALAGLTGSIASLPMDETATALNSGAVHLLRAVRRVDRETGLPPAQLSALSVLVFGGPLTLGALAGAEDVAGPTMTRIVDGLVGRGLAERQPTGDRRAVRVVATGGRAGADGRRPAPPGRGAHRGAGRAAGRGPAPAAGGGPAARPAGRRGPRPDSPPRRSWPSHVEELRDR